jgi:hypothetical protein
MGEAVDVASVVRTARQVRGVHPTNGEVISRVAEVLTGGGHIVWVVRIIREMQRMSGLDELGRAECIRMVESRLCEHGVAVPDTHRARERRGDAEAGCGPKAYGRDGRRDGRGQTNEAVPRAHVRLGHGVGALSRRGSSSAAAQPRGC